MELFRGDDIKNKWNDINNVPPNCVFFWEKVKLLVCHVGICLIRRSYMDGVIIKGSPDTDPNKDDITAGRGRPVSDL